MKASEKLLKCIEGLPSDFGVLNHIRAVVCDKHSTTEEVVKAVTTDPAFSARVLKLANSAYIGLPNAVSSLRNAVVLLGRKRIEGLAMINCGLSLGAGKTNVMSSRAFWRHSLAVGMLSESIARHCLRYEAFDVDELFAAGVLHDIGMLILDKSAPRHLQGVVDHIKHRRAPFFQLEPGDYNHVTIGMFAAEQWHFPQVLVHTTGYHHAPLDAGVYCRQAAVVHLADLTAGMIGLQTIENDCLPMPDQRALELVPLPAESLRVIAQKVFEDQKKMESLIDALL